MTNVHLVKGFSFFFTNDLFSIYIFSGVTEKIDGDFCILPEKSAHIHSSVGLSLLFVVPPVGAKAVSVSDLWP